MGGGVSVAAGVCVMRKGVAGAGPEVGVVPVRMGAVETGDGVEAGPNTEDSTAHPVKAGPNNTHNHGRVIF